mmetsp:Transcript_172/g.679  ORF Transcript_172/g.679 Transcript_172/m.679 type:complete len:223 (+) Transcript_172:638-1306(+)
MRWRPRRTSERATAPDGRTHRRSRSSSPRFARTRAREACDSKPSTPPPPPRRYHPPPPRRRPSRPPFPRHPRPLCSPPFLFVSSPARNLASTLERACPQPRRTPPEQTSCASGVTRALESLNPRRPRRRRQRLSASEPSARREPPAPACSARARAPRGGGAGSTRPSAASIGPPRTPRRDLVRSGTWTRAGSPQRMRRRRTARARAYTLGRASRERARGFPR